jgi:hypothetical protein
VRSALSICISRIAIGQEQLLPEIALASRDGRVILIIISFISLKKISGIFFGIYFELPAGFLTFVRTTENQRL